MISLVRGPSDAEQRQGLFVGFDSIDPADAARIDVDAVLDDDGTLHHRFALDGQGWTPGSLAGTSSQVFEFVDPLYATAFQFPDVTGIDRPILCWNELSCEGIFSRESWKRMIGANTQHSVGPGCGILGAWFDPDC